MATIEFSNINLSDLSTTEKSFKPSSIYGNKFYTYTWEYQFDDGFSTIQTTVSLDISPYMVVRLSNNNDIILVKFGFNVSCTPNKKLDYGCKPRPGESTGTASFIVDKESSDTSVSFTWSAKTFGATIGSSVNTIAIEFVPNGQCIIGNKLVDKSDTYMDIPPLYIDYDLGRLRTPDDPVYSDITDLSVVINELLKDKIELHWSYSAKQVPAVKTTVAFRDYKGMLLASGDLDIGTYDIDAMAVMVGVSPVQQTRPSERKSATTYNVNFYMDSSLTSKTGNSQTIKGGESTITYTHKEDPDTRHFYWKDGKNGDPLETIKIVRNKSYDFYPVFTESATEATLPTNLPTNGFYGKERVGYRAENGSRTNNTYYAKNGTQVERGGGITQDMISGTNIDLYLKWIPVKYTIRFNKGNADGWANPTNTLGTITKTYGENIGTSDSRYPTQFTRLLLNGYLQRGWVNNGSSVYSNGDNSICTYSYSGDYVFTKQPITDKWYNDNMSGVDVYPSWYPVNHKVLAHYYTTKGGTEKLDTYNFNIGSAHLSINEPKELDDKSSTWVFLGWAQITKPKGDGWEWGSGGTDIRNYGAFRYITDLKDIQYFRSYGVNSKSLTKEDWDNTSKNLDIYALWSINSRYVFVGNAWRPTTGIWVYIDGAWRSVDSIYYQSSNLPTTSTWKQEIV